MFKFNRKAVTSILVGVFAVTVLLILGKGLHDSNKEKQELESVREKLEKEVTDLKEEKEVVEDELGKKSKEAEENKKKSKKLESDVKKTKKKIKEKDGEIEGLKKDLEAKKEAEKAKKEKLLAEKESKKSGVGTSNSGEKSSGESKGTGKVYNMDATHYSAYCPTCGEWGGITATGDDISNSIYVRGHRVVAVDPSVIPLGSKVKVTGGGYDFEALALDTGGDIKGSRLDILVGSTEEAYNLGRKDVKVEILR